MAAQHLIGGWSLIDYRVTLGDDQHTYRIIFWSKCSRKLDRPSVQVSSHPNWIGTVQSRLATLTEDKMLLEGFNLRLLRYYLIRIFDNSSGFMLIHGLRAHLRDLFLHGLEYRWRGNNDTCNSHW